jgi:hypothetical protein
MRQVEHLPPGLPAQDGVFPYQDTNQGTLDPTWQMGLNGQHFSNPSNFLNQDDYFTNLDEIDSNQSPYLNQCSNLVETTYYGQSESSWQSIDVYPQTKLNNFDCDSFIFPNPVCSSNTQNLQISDELCKSTHNARKEQTLESIKPHPAQILPYGPACLMTNADKCRKYRDNK